jgi:hypothetical protein
MLKYIIREGGAIQGLLKLKGDFRVDSKKTKILKFVKIQHWKHWMLKAENAE